MNDIHILHSIPIFRMFDVHKAKEFYLEYLGFRLDWEHRFEPDSPLYMQVTLHNFSLHLSEHYGDATPGSSIRLTIDDIEAFHRDLLQKNYKYLRPGIESTEWDTLEVKLTDPFGNRIIFSQAKVNG